MSATGQIKIRPGFVPLTEEERAKIFIGIWKFMDCAPKDGSRFLAVMDGRVRVVAWGKISHIGWAAFCLADQGPEDFDSCQPSCWMPLPAPPRDEPASAKSD